MTAIPPKGHTGVELSVTEVPHGWDVVGKVRLLKRAVPGDVPSNIMPQFSVWIALTKLLIGRGGNVEELVATVREDVDRET